MSYSLTPKDLNDLLYGACFFGSGGGGTLESARSLLAHFQVGDYYPADRVRVVDVDEATNGDAVMVAYLGSPAAIDGATYPLGPVQAVMEVQAALAKEGRRLAYLAPPESGALGFLVACLVAAKLDLAVIDADGAGRAVPALPQLTYAAQGVNPRPAILVSQSGLSVELDVRPREGVNGTATHQQDVASIIDQMLRPIVAQSDFAQFGGLAMWIMDPATLRRALPIRGTLTRALTLGRALSQSKLHNAQDMIAYLNAQFGLQAVALFPPGRFVSAELDTSSGFDLGRIRIESGQRSCTVLYQNESLLAWDSSRAAPLCMAPDSISYFVEGEGQAVFSNGDLVLADGSLNPALKNRQVSVLGLRANPVLCERDGPILESFMQLVAGIGYLGPYVPLATDSIDSTGSTSTSSINGTSTGQVQA